MFGQKQIKSKDTMQIVKKSEVIDTKRNTPYKENMLCNSPKLKLDSDVKN